MPQSLSQLYSHLIFSTKNRQKLIGRDIEKELFNILGSAVNSSGSQSIKVGGHLDHVHVLFNLSRTKTVAKTVEIIKTTSSKWMKQQDQIYQNFYWQDGYAIFSVSPLSIDRVIDYISNQKSHHLKKSFQDECRAFFEKYKMDYDERYVWD